MNGTEPLPEVGREADPTPTSTPDQHPLFAGHRRNGQFAPANAVAVTHGGGRRQPAVKPETTETFTSWANDLGGVGELTTPERLLVERGVEAAALAAGAARYLRSSRRSLTNPRVLAAIDAWAKATGQLRSIAQTLGLKRRSKELNVAEQLAQFHRGGDQ